MAKILKVKKNTPRTIKLELTEGEVDFIIGLTALVRGDRKSSPAKYAERLSRILKRAVGYDFTDSDAFYLAEGLILFHDYE